MLNIYQKDKDLLKLQSRELRILQNFNFPIPRETLTVSYKVMKEKENGNRMIKIFQDKGGITYK